MPDNDFLPFATAPGANVVTQAQWAAIQDRQAGFQAGTAYSARVNKALRQSSAMASALGLFIVSNGFLSALDNGDIAGLKSALAVSIAQFDAKYTFANDSGVVNNLVATLDPAPISYFEGMEICFVPQGTNTDISYLSVNGLGNREIKRRDGTSCQSGDLIQGAPYYARYMGAPVGGVFRLITLAQGEVTRIVANPTLYVRSDGSDSNRGTSNTAGGAFRTIDAAQTYGVSYLTLTVSQQLTIQLGLPGNYAAPSTTLRPSGNITILGDPANQGAFIISGTGNAGFPQLIGAAGGGSVTITGVTLQNTGTLYPAINMNGTVNVILQNVSFSAISTVNSPCIQVGVGTLCTIKNGCIFSGNFSVLFYSAGGAYFLGNSLITVGNNPNYSTATVVVTNGGQIVSSGASFAGTATGVRYSVSVNGVINTAGAGANFFPGSIAGATPSTGGQYV